MIEHLKSSGICRLGILPWVKEFTYHLANCERYPGHVKARPRAGIECNSMADVMAAPHFLAYAQSLTPLASKFFGKPAHLWSLNAFYTDKHTPYIGSLNGLHVDREADHMLTLFMLGTDTGPDGAQIVAHEGTQWNAMWGPAGSAWLTDVSRLHCGLLPLKPRLLAWARWADMVPLAKYTEQLPDLP